MKIGSYAAAAALLVAGLSAAPAAAQSTDTINAADPAGILASMIEAGHEAELTVDGIGDPLIVSRINGLTMLVFFYGCNETTNDNCDSLQFYIGFTVDTPWTPARAQAITQRLRFASVRLDDQGNPSVAWDFLTGNGVPEDLFVAALRQFEQTMYSSAQIVFADVPASGAASE